jgi:hypothetical protein
MTASESRIVRRAGAALAGLLALVAGVGPIAAETALEARPADAVPTAELDRLSAIADQIGWGSLFRTEQMAAADTAYAAGPVLAVTAMPYLPVHFWLESRAWAVERFRPLADADERFMAFVVDPKDGLVFDLLVIGETDTALDQAALDVTYVDSTGTRLPATIDEHAMSDERAMGGSLRTARARLTVTFDEAPDWSAVETIGLEVTAAGEVFAVGWRLPPAD